MSIYLVTIDDKELYGEPDIALAVVDAPDEETARCAAQPMLAQLIDHGRCRCTPYVRLLELGRFYRLGAVVRLPRNSNVEEPEVKKDHTHE